MARLKQTHEVYFKIYYGDEKVVKASVDQLESAPRLNVQAIAWADPDESAYGVGRCVLSGADYYLYVRDQERFIQVTNQTDLIDHVLHSGEIIAFKGRTIRDSIFYELRKRAFEEVGLPQKSRVNPQLEGNA